MRKRRYVWLSVLACSIACGSSSDDPTITPENPDGSTTADGGGQDSGFALLDGSADDGATSDAASGADGGPASPCSSANACAGGQACVNGACACPPYRTFCNGACLPTSADPANCGGCGVKCTGDLACSAGACSATCQPGLDKCSNACVDKKNDSANCGTCGKVCPAGQGCIDGTCGATIGTSGSPPKCAGGTGPIVAVPGKPSTCLQGIAQTVFRWALCSCKDVQFSASYLTDGYDSTKGPYVPGGLGASVGANENHGASSTGEVWGTLWIAGSGGLSPQATHVVKSDARAGGQLKSSGPFSIGENAYAEEDVSTSSSLSIGQTLFVPNGKTVGGNVTYQTLTRQAVSVLPPCDFCEPSDQVPIVDIVEAKRAPNNDNALIGLAANAFASPGGPRRLDLPCGEYYLSGISSSSHVTIMAHGRTALYIEGNVSPDGITFGIAPGAELDVFITGSLGTSGTFSVGSANSPASTRVYVAGTSGVTISSGVTIAGNLYVPNGAVTYSSDAEQFGAIYAGNFSTSKPLKLHYDRAVVTVGDATCGTATPGTSPGPDGGSGEGGSSSGGDGGTGAGGCGSCLDCANQACINGACGACGTSADCCAPLVCRSGRCIPNIK